MRTCRICCLQLTSLCQPSCPRMNRDFCTFEFNAFWRKTKTFAGTHLFNQFLAGILKKKKEKKSHVGLVISDFVFVWFLLSGWSADLATLRFASGTSRPVSVYTSSWATLQRYAASSTTAAGWSAVPTTSWSKFGIQKQKRACTRCRATPTECTPYR